LPCALYTEGPDYQNYIPCLKHIEVYFTFLFFLFNFITEVGQRLPDNNWRILLDVYFALWHFWVRMVTVQSVCQLTKLLGFHGSDVSYYLDDWLTVHRSITLVDLQLDAQNFLFVYI